MALLRAIGASRRQVLGSVLLEAVVVGLIASLAGIVAGVGVASGLKALLGDVGLDIPAGGIVLTSKHRRRRRSSPASASALRRPSSPPARRRRCRRSRRCATSPSTARAAAVAGMRRRLGRRRHWVRSRMGAGLFGGGWRRTRSALGAPLVFIGVGVLGPVLARPLSRVHRLRRCRGQGHGRHARPGERDAQSEAHVVRPPRR